MVKVRIHYIYRPQRSWGKVMFLQVCVILFTGGEYLTRYPPGPGTPPRPGTPPGTRYTTRTRYTPLDQVHPPRSGTPPQNQVHPPYQVHPPDQVHPPIPGTPPGPGRYGLHAGGTHPTGMQSCFDGTYFWAKRCKNVFHFQLNLSIPKTVGKEFRFYQGKG